MKSRSLCWTLCLLLPTLALGRGGGGQHYSGGSHPSSPSGAYRSSSGGRTYGGGASPGYAPGYGGGGGTASLGGGGLCCLLLLLITVYVLYRFWKRRGLGAVQSAPGQRGPQDAAAAPPVSELVAALRTRDAAFELTAFLAKVEAIFLSVQQGWFERNLEMARPFLSDATYERFGVQLQLLASQGIRNALRDVQVKSLELAGLEQNDWYDTIHVRITASMRDTDVPAATSDADALREAERCEQVPFTEVWSLVRKPGAQTRAGQDALVGKCPNCGAPFTGGAANNCTYCGAILNSGTYDWVLAEITQDSEAAETGEPVDGIESIRASDPALSLEVLEDRASLIFFKWVEASSNASARPLAKLATPEALAQVEREASALRARGERRVFLECAVGAVVTRAFTTTGGRQRAHVEVRWSARGGVLRQGSATPDFPTASEHSMLTLTRNEGVTTPTKTGMSTYRCPQCHAPLTASASSNCDFCGAQLSDGGRDWVFEGMVPVEEWESPARDLDERPST